MIQFKRLFALAQAEPVPPDFVSFRTLLEKLRSADAALARINEAVIQTDRQGDILYANLAAERLTGIPMERLRGSRFDQAVAMMPIRQRSGAVPSCQRVSSRFFAPNPVTD